MPFDSLPQIETESREKQVLQLALRFVERPDGWTQGKYARGYFGLPCKVAGSWAKSFCAVGAIQRAAWELSLGYGSTKNAEFVLEMALGRPIVRWNDSRYTTKEHVIAAFKNAIQLA